MTQVTINSDEFIIKMMNENVLAVFQGREEVVLRLTNPHGDQADSGKFEALTILLDVLSTINNPNATKNP